MNLPTKEECFEILKEYEVPQNIVNHVLKVSEVSVFLAKKLVEKGIKVNIDLVEKGAILHDLDKIPTKDNYKDHGLVTERILIKKGFPELGSIARSHKGEDIKHGLVKNWEEKIVNYIDKRVEETKIVSVVNRFEQGRKRYPHLSTPEHIKTEEYVLELEKEIFSHLNFKPEDLKQGMEK